MARNNPHKQMNTRLKILQDLSGPADGKTPSVLIEEVRTWLKETMGGQWGPLWIATQKTKALEEEVARLLIVEGQFTALEQKYETLITKVNHGTPGKTVSSHP